MTSPHFLLKTALHYQQHQHNSILNTLISQFDFVKSRQCEGHISIEDVPGMGEKMPAKAIARPLGCMRSPP
ncbi:hypothetical protein ACFLUO_08725 [Chloroflexota bacterium]